MFTLHIEHAISDFAVWQRAYAGFAEHRGRAGVVADRVARPVDDDAFVVIDLDFPSAEQAEAFRRFLRDRVWSSRDLSPALAGEPRADILRRESAAAAPVGAAAGAGADQRG